jgi:hypothetical protein
VQSRGRYLPVNVRSESRWHAGRNRNRIAVAPRDPSVEEVIMWRTIATVAVAISVAACGTGKQPAQTPSATTTTIPASGGQQVVIAESGGSPRGQVRHQLAGQITDVERNKGEVTVRSADGSKMKIVLPPLAVANMREGDDVSLDVLVTPRR